MHRYVDDEPKESSISAACFGLLFVLPAKALVFVALSKLSPRSHGRGFDCVLMPWGLYSAIAHFLPVILIYVAALLFFRTQRRRLLVAGGAAVTTFLWYSMLGADWLRADYAGKLF